MNLFTYEKGYCFVYYLSQLCGDPQRFDDFLRVSGPSRDRPPPHPRPPPWYGGWWWWWWSRGLGGELGPRARRWFLPLLPSQFGLLGETWVAGVGASVPALGPAPLTTFADPSVWGPV